MARPWNSQSCSTGANAPERGLTNAASLDLFCAKTLLIPSRGRGIVPTYIAIRFPKGTYVHMCELYLVLGMSLLRFISVGKGVIDCGLMENITVILFNHGNQMFKVEKRRHDCTINT